MVPIFILCDNYYDRKEKCYANYLEWKSDATGVPKL